MMGHDSLANFIKTNYALETEHGYAPSEIEGFIPWERHVRIDLIQARLKAEFDKQIDEMNRQKDLTAFERTYGRFK